MSMAALQNILPGRLAGRSVRHLVAEVLIRIVTGPERLFTLLEAWQYRAQENYRLADMEPHRLDDMGMSPADRDRELARPFRFR